MFLRAIIKGCYTLRSIPLKLLCGRIGANPKISPFSRIHGYRKGIFIGDDVRLFRYAEIDNASPGNIALGDNIEIYPFATLCSQGGKIEIGDRSRIGPYSIVYGLGGVHIGKNVLIAAHVAIVAAAHNIDDPNIPIIDQGVSGKPIHVEDNAWIGTGVKILAGCTIGEGAVIGAGSIVTKDIPPKAIVAGVPAKIIRFRR